MKFELIKEIVDQAVQEGKRLQSSQTGFIHYHEHASENEIHQTIPFYENLLFALALLRTKMVEQINEAKELIEKLLSFEIVKDPSKGLFPYYLHEYPICKTSYLDVQLLAPFYWILRGFGHVLGAELKGKLERLVLVLLENGKNNHTKSPYPYHMAVRLSSGQVAFGRLFQNESLANEGSDQLQKLCQLGMVDSWYYTKRLSDILIGLQMAYKSISDSPWNVFWSFIEKTWHQSSSCYVGPCIREEQKKGEPKVSLYDYFMSYFSQHLHKRMKNPNPCQLHAVIIHPTEDVFSPHSPSELSGVYKENQWQLWNEENWALTLMEKKEPLDPTTDRTVIPFRYVWTNENAPHSFVCQGGKIKTVTYHKTAHETELFFQLDHFEVVESRDNRDSHREIGFYFDFQKDVEIVVNDIPTNTFELGQKIVITTAGQCFSLQFDLEQGQGQFLGHVIRGNRPAQIDLQGDQRFNSYDWFLFIRTIRRVGPCTLKVKIQYHV